MGNSRCLPLKGFKYVHGSDNQKPDHLSEPQRAYLVEDDRLNYIEVVLCRINREWRAFHFGTAFELCTPTHYDREYPTVTRSDCLEFVVEHLIRVGKEKILDAISKQTVIYKRKEQ